jgi:small subunit ribosomal protein S6
LDVEMFNRGMQPLAYNIKTRNMGGVSSRYLDGIYLLFTYVIKPESQLALQKKLNADDDIIRSTTFRLKA